MITTKHKKPTALETLRKELAMEQCNQMLYVDQYDIVINRDKYNDSMKKIIKIKSAINILEGFKNESV